LRYSRKEFTEDQKIDIMQRDAFKCSACDTRDEYLQVYHVMPCARGGENDVWNGQVLCSRCNLAKGSDWGNARWPRKRNELIHFYLTFGWPWLDYEEQNLLVAEASNRREITAYFPFSGIVSTSWVESFVCERKLIISASTPGVRIADGRVVLAGNRPDSVPESFNVTDGQIEKRRVMSHGDRFLWHAHVTKPSRPPQWAMDMADQP
jgi:hypothetical protein